MTRLTFLWDRVIGTLWFVPVMMSLAAVSLVVACGYLAGTLTESGERPFFLYAGDVESARIVLSTVAGSIITVAGVSFSVTMVALSLASSQFGPHLLVNFMRDRGNQIVLGSFIATFLFCLLSLGTTTREAEGYASLCASVALVLTGISLGLLIYFIHHIASSMQADRVVQEVAAQARVALDRLFPEEAGETAGDVPAFPVSEPVRVVGVEQTGYLQAVDEAGLLSVAEEHDLIIRVLCRPGHFVIEGAALLELSGSNAERVPLKDLHGNFIIGGSRTAYQDPEFGIQQLVEVAVRAMSSGINDPFTAITCVDRLTGLLCRIAPVPARPPTRLDDAGRPRLYLDPVDFSGVADAAFDQIRQFSSGIPAVSIRLLEGLAEIAALVRDPKRRDAVQRQAKMLVAARREELQEADREALDERYRRLQRVFADSASTLTAQRSPKSNPSPCS